jgi:AcrB/AcrD/AcrF family
VSGATGVRRVRSASAIGISIVWVEFDWSTDKYVARQVVNEKLQIAAAELPPDLPRPTLAPIASIMGEILFIAIRSDRHSPMEVREAADWTVRRRLLAIPGVAQVVPIGGEVRQYQVSVNPARLRAFDVMLDEVAAALRAPPTMSSTTPRAYGQDPEARERDGEAAAALHLEPVRGLFAGVVGRYRDALGSGGENGVIRDVITGATATFTLGKFGVTAVGGFAGVETTDGGSMQTGPAGVVSLGAVF